MCRGSTVSASDSEFDRFNSESEPDNPQLVLRVPRTTIIPDSEDKFDAFTSESEAEDEIIVTLDGSEDQDHSDDESTPSPAASQRSRTRLFQMTAWKRTMSQTMNSTIFPAASRRLGMRLFMVNSSEHGNALHYR